MTVSGFTMTRTSRQRDQKTRSVVQNRRSREFKVGRGRFAFENGNLLTESKNFEGRVASTTPENTDHREDGEDEFRHELLFVTWRNVASPRHRQEDASG